MQEGYNQWEDIDFMTSQTSIQSEEDIKSQSGEERPIKQEEETDRGREKRGTPSEETSRDEELKENKDTNIQAIRRDEEGAGSADEVWSEDWWCPSEEAGEPPQLWRAAAERVSGEPVLS